MTTKIHRNASRWGPFGLPFGTLGAPLGPPWAPLVLPFAPLALPWTSKFRLFGDLWTKAVPNGVPNPNLDPIWPYFASFVDVFYGSAKPHLARNMKTF